MVLITCKPRGLTGNMDSKSFNYWLRPNGLMQLKAISHYSIFILALISAFTVTAADQPDFANLENYKRAEIEIRKLVESGKVSAEDAEKRLMEMHQLITRDKQIKPKKPRKSDGQFSRDEYRRAEIQIRRLVKSGKVSKKDAERRLNQMRQRIKN